MATASIPGYDYGDSNLTRSPVTPGDLDLLLQTVLFTDGDQRALRMAGEVLEPQIEAILDVWYGFVGANPHLVASFLDRDGQPIGAYLERVRGRFGQWIRDLCTRPFDQAWLDYQHEIALRHAKEKKNATDGVDAATNEIAMRYMVAFIVPITATIRPFLASGSATAEEVEAMYTAWFKVVTLSVVLWCRPYVREGSW